MRFRTFAVTLAALFAVPAAQASANTITTKTAYSDGGDSTVVQASLTNSCDADVSYRYGPSPDQLSQTLGSSANPHHAPSDSDNTRISGLTEGTTYYYQAVLTSPCGNAQGAVRCFVHSSTINTEENPACPNDPGDGGSTGGNTDGNTDGNTGGNSGGNQQSSGPHHIHPKGHRCITTSDFLFVLELKVQHVKCQSALKLLDTRKARNLIGRKRKVNLGKFHCSALNRLEGEADYHCVHGHKGWYMHTYASGAWDAPDVAFVDY